MANWEHGKSRPENFSICYLMDILMVYHSCTMHFGTFPISFQLAKFLYTCRCQLWTSTIYPFEVSPAVPVIWVKDGECDKPQSMVIQAWNSDIFRPRTHITWLSMYVRCFYHFLPKDASYKSQSWFDRTSTFDHGHWLQFDGFLGNPGIMAWPRVRPIFEPAVWHRLYVGLLWAYIGTYGFVWFMWFI